MLTMSHILTGHQMKTHNSSLANLCRGVGERVLYTDSKCTVPTKPKIGIFESRLASYRDQLCRSIGWQSPVSRNEFLGFYKGPRLATYQRAVASLAYKPVGPRDAELKTFVKAEKLNFSLKPDPAPRVIQPRSPRFNVEIGKYLRPLERKMYHAIDGLFGAPTIMSEYNAFDTARIIKAKWDKFIDPVCIGMDASRFDQHVSQQALKFEHSIYNKIFKSSELAGLLNMQLVNVGFATACDGGFRYIKKGSRMSGDMNTSLGNKIIMCLMAHSYLSTLSFEVSFVNNGDDCLLITERKHAHKFGTLDKYFKDFGFKIVCEPPVYELEQVEFCQSKPVCSNGVWRMVRNVKTCLSKDLTCVNLGHNEEEYRAWLHDVGTCGSAIANDIPILSEFYSMLRRMGREANYSHKFDNGYRWYYNASKNAHVPLVNTPDDHGRFSFWLSTGISPDLQISLEDILRTATWGASKRQLTSVIHSLFEK